MNFSAILVEVKNGKKICRAGWNGKGMYVVYQPGRKNCIRLDTTKGSPFAEHVTGHVNTPVNYLPYLLLCTADGSFVPWLASQTDILADDWEVYIEPKVVNEFHYLKWFRINAGADFLYDRDDEDDLRELHDAYERKTGMAVPDQWAG